MYDWLFMDFRFVALAAANDPPEHISTIIGTIDAGLMNPDIYTILSFFSSNVFESL